MTDTVKLSEQVSIREFGKDEYWLQQIIFSNPSCLGLGELEPLHKEKKQSSGGRLDILLEDPEDGSRYEVEVMLGATDETHIIRTIEYWARERRKYPMRQHYAVLVAEQINKRFFEVVFLLSDTIPIIAIQASLRKADGVVSLGFDKILDVYEEPAGNQDGGVTTEEDWNKKSPWTVINAKSFLDVAKTNFPNLSLSIMLVATLP